jgi:uncharacterized membrane protein (UPF0127 family)
MKLPFKFNFNGKKIVVNDYSICNNVFSKGRGLMFRSKNYKTPLLFPFNKPGRYSIHSFFCRKFIAVWLAKGKIVDIQLVEPWKFSVTGKEKFDELLEIPVSLDE